MPVLGLVFAVAVQRPIQLKPHIVISKSGSVAARTYNFGTGADLKTAAVEIKGNNITVDFKNATLQGTPQTTDPDKRQGLGLRVSGNNITIKNLRVRGYKIALLARDCMGLKIVDSDFSYNWKQHLASTLEKEDLSDWQSYHHNEHDEWYGYGAGIYLWGCDKFEVRNCKVVGGQCGLMITQCNLGTIWNNDFSFNSGLGLGMYRSSGNRIMHNNIDWDVRGFSYGVYNRGQDSAGILIFEQCSRNVFAYNSVTHGGDGFFLWAGQHTMDTGDGGCNDNLLFGNDFSHAPTNGIEATFSRNKFINNLVLECWHGIWGGYSYDSKVIANVFGHNAEAIAWEHGQNNLVDSNYFTADNEGVNIWSNPQQDPNWIYAKKRDTRSMNWKITNNEFVDEYTNVLHVRRSEKIDFSLNTLIRYGTAVKSEGEVKDLKNGPNSLVEGAPAPPSSSLNQGKIGSVDEYLHRFYTRWSPYLASAGNGFGQQSEVQRHLNRQMAALPYIPKPMVGGKVPFLKPGTLRGWRYILVDEWGPYDFKRPILWPRETLNPGVTGKVTRHRFEILGPKGRWKVVKKQGVAHMSAESGTVPGVVDVELPVGQASSTDIVLEYVGGPTTDYRGIVTPAGKPVRFGYSKFFAPIDWSISFFKWSRSSNPAEAHANPDEAALQEIFRGTPVKELKSDKLDFAGASFDAATGNDHFATVATGTFSIQPGDYVLELTSDDGARLWLDDKPLIQDAWHYQGPTLYSRDVHLGAGKHTIRVEHFQIDGYGALKVNLRPKK